MRAGLFAFAVLATTASAAPRNRRHIQLHAHEKRAVVTDVVYATDIVYVTATAPEAVAYQDGNGNVVSTSYHSQQTNSPPQAPDGYIGSGPENPNTPAQKPVPITSTIEAPGYAPPAYTPQQSSPQAPVDTTPTQNGPQSTPTQEQQAPPAAESSPSSTSGSNPPADSGDTNGTTLSGHGMSYTPYNADGTVKDQDTVTKDLAAMEDFSTVRIYDTNSHQVAMLIQAAKPKGMKVIAGFNTVNNVAEDTQNIIDDAKDDWDSIHSVAVGNEIVRVNSAAAPAVVAALNTARGMLRAAGFTGPVVTVDIPITFQQHPELCQNSDYAAANIHAWFASNIHGAAGAADFVKSQANWVASVCGGKDVVVTESGWPWQATIKNNGENVASPEQQSLAIEGLKSRFPNNMILFSPYDDSWKEDGEFGCEKYWGFVSHAAA